MLTAAHCVDGGATPGQLKLVIGAKQLNDERPETPDVSAIHIHPSWNPSTFDNDVALLRLATPSTKRWARLAEPADPVNPGNPVRAIGHGHTTAGRRPAPTSCARSTCRSSPTRRCRAARTAASSTAP